MKLSGLAKKEVKEFFSDRGFLIFLFLTMLLAPLVIMFVFGYGFQADIKNLDVIVIDEDGSEYSEKIIQAIKDSDDFNLIEFSGKLAEAKYELGKSVKAVFHIPENFESNLNEATKAGLFLYIDSSDYIIYNAVKIKAGGVVEDSLRDIIEIVVLGLEEETSEKKLISRGIQNSMDILDSKIKANFDDLDEINLGSFSASLDDLKSEVGDFKNSCTECTSSTTSINSDIDAIKASLADYKSKLDNIEDSGEDTQAISLDIKNRIKNIDLELKGLKSDFLSYPLDIDKQYVYGQISYFKYLAPALISICLFFVCFVLSSVSMIGRKKSKIKAIERIKVFSSKFLILLFVGIFELSYILLMARYIFGVGFSGNILGVGLVLVLLVCASVGLGLLSSFIFKTQKQAIILVPLIVMPLILISGAFSPIEIMPKFAKYISYASPMFYSNLALRELMIKGAGLADIGMPIFWLMIYAFAVLFAGILLCWKRL